MLLDRSNLLCEAIFRNDFIIDLTRNISGGLDLPHPDYVAKLAKWRQRCENYNESWHGAHCTRCDEAWRYPTGGAKWASRTDWYSPPPIRSGSDNSYPNKRLLAPVADSGSVLPPLKDSGEKMAPYGRISDKGNFSYAPPSQNFDYGVSGPEIAPKIYESCLYSPRTLKFAI